MKFSLLVIASTATLLSQIVMAHPKLISEQVFKGPLDEILTRFRAVSHTCEKNKYAVVADWQLRGKKPNTIDKSAMFSFLRFDAREEKFKLDAPILNKVDGLFYYNDIKLAPDCGFIVTGQHLESRYIGDVLRFDADGILLWRKEIHRADGYSTYVNTSIVDKSGVTLFGAMGKIIKLDLQGEKVWEIQYFGNLTSALKTKNGDLIAVGTKWVDNLNPGKPVFLKLDSSGKIIMEKSFDDIKFGWRSLVEIKGGNYAAATWDSVVLFDKEGKILSILETPNLESDILVNSKNELIFPVTEKTSGNALHISSQTLDGKPNWKFTVPGSPMTINTLKKGIEIKQGRYLFVGTFNSPKNPMNGDNSRAYLVMIEEK